MPEYDSVSVVSIIERSDGSSGGLMRTEPTAVDYKSDCRVLAPKRKKLSCFRISLRNCQDKRSFLGM